MAGYPLPHISPIACYELSVFWSCFRRIAGVTRSMPTTEDEADLPHLAIAFSMLLTFEEHLLREEKESRKDRVKITDGGLRQYQHHKRFIHDGTKYPFRYDFLTVIKEVINLDADARGQGKDDVQVGVGEADIDVDRIRDFIQPAFDELDEEFIGVCSDNYILELMNEILDEIEESLMPAIKPAKREAPKKDESLLEPPKKRVKKTLIIPGYESSEL